MPLEYVIVYAALSNSCRISSEIIFINCVEVLLQPFTAVSNANTCKCNDASSITNSMYVCSVFTWLDAALD